MTAPRARSRCGPRLSVEIEIGEQPWTVLGALDPTSAVEEVAAAVVAHVELPAAATTATLALATDAEVRTLNKTWRSQDKPTNVLSFPSALPPGGLDGRARFLGDVVLAEETLAREAADQGITPADHFRHLVLHGLLHLLGYDHETDAQAHEMETLEVRILAAIGVADPYAATEPVASPPPTAQTTRRA
jgi:probable rRNA maturation factor